MATGDRAAAAKLISDREEWESLSTLREFSGPAVDVMFTLVGLYFKCLANKQTSNICNANVVRHFVKKLNGEVD